jgi:type II secretory pathway component PulF
MQFHFIGSDSGGKIVEEDIEARNKEEVLSIIVARGLKPVSIKAIKGLSLGNIELFAGKINISDQIFISKYLALMLKIGTGLLQAINILLEDFSKPAVRQFLIEVRSNLEKGKPFYAAFEKYNDAFSQVYVNSVRAGEASGSLEKVFENMTESLAKEKTLRDQIRGALFYPIILLTSSLGILFFLIMFALPKIAGVFSQSGFQPPLFSRVVFSVGLFLGKFGGYAMGIMVLGGIAFFVFYKYSHTFKRFVGGLFSSIPIIKDIIKKISIQRFAATLSSLIRAGMPITDALEITADSVSQIELKEALMRISKEGITKGLTLGEAFKREPYFPKTIVNLIAISEHAGHIEEVLGTLADFYVSEIDSALKTLVSFLEPIMLVFIGLVVGLIALAIVVPIYQLTMQF